MIQNVALTNPGALKRSQDYLRAFQRMLPEYNLVYIKRILPSIDVAGQRVYPGIFENLEDLFPEPLETVLKALENHAHELDYSKTAHAQNSVNMARIACLLELHSLEGQGYPESLDGLGASLPHDVLTGQDFYYQRTNDGRYRLYSLGWDLVDDGGEDRQKEHW